MKHQHKNISRRLAAAMMAGAMMVSMVGMTAFAQGSTSPITGDGESGITSINITKTITTDGNTYAPNTTFTITVDEGAGKTFNDGKGDVTALPGVERGLSGATIKSTPDTDELTSDSYSFYGALTVNIEAFTDATPGVYHYVVSEDSGSYEGIDYDTTDYDLYLYLMRNETTNQKYIGYAVCVKQGDSNIGTADAKSALTFTNNYGDGDTPDDDGKIHDVIITKKIVGTFADMSDTFSFNVKVNGADGEYYKVEYTNGETTNTTFVGSGNTGITISDIGHEDTIHIYGLSENDTYMVTETDGTSQGYTVSDSVVTDADGTVSGKVTVDGDTETITNTKNATTPTGIAMTIAPYAIMVVAASGVAFLFLRRRHSEF